MFQYVGMLIASNRSLSQKSLGTTFLRISANDSGISKLLLSEIDWRIVTNWKVLNTIDVFSSLYLPGSSTSDSTTL